MSATIHGRITVQANASTLKKARPKRGELLLYRPRQDARASTGGGVTEPGVAEPRTGPQREPWTVLKCCGREFRVRESMARIFLRRSQDIIAAGGAELVPLLHADGVDLLLITPDIPFTMVTEVEPLV